MGIMERIREDWLALTLIGGIFVGGILGFNYTMAQAETTANKAVDARVNKAMIDGASQAAADAVAKQLPAISKQVAQDTAKAILEEQRKEDAKKEKKVP